MGCLFALFAGLFPRLGLFIIWIVRPALVNAAFDTFILPLLGIIFLPFATLIYVVLYIPGVGLTGWGWFWVILAALFDIGQWGPATPSGTRSPGCGAGENGNARHESYRARMVCGLERKVLLILLGTKLADFRNSVR
jgi:hypothetical protein